MLKALDIANIVNSFKNADWDKSRELFEKYLQEQNNKDRKVWIACCNGKLAGYVTLNWQTLYLPFKHNNIPEIQGLNVLPNFRNQVIGTKLLRTAEKEAHKKSNLVGLGVGLYDGYGAAHKLYISQGYIPNGKGITHNYLPIKYGQSTTLDDDLILWFTKVLK